MPPRPLNVPPARALLEVTRPHAAVRALAAAWGPAGLFGLFSLLYGLTATHGYTFDAVSYALQIRRFEESGEWRWLFHPHHLLFNAAGLLVRRLALSVGADTDPLSALQAMNMALGAAGVVLLARVAGRLCRDRGTGILAGAGLGLSYGYWTCATDGRVNLAGLVALIGAVAIILVLLDPAVPRSPASFIRWAAALGGLHGLAVLLHQSHALFAMPALTALALAREAPRRRALCAYVGVVAGVVGLSYVAAARLSVGEGSVSEVPGWALTYARHGWWWSLDLWRNLGLDVQASAHALVASPTLSGAPGASAAYYSAWVLAAVGAVLAAVHIRGLGEQAAQTPAQAGHGSLARVARARLQRRVLWVLLAWGLSYAGFFTFWNPGYFVFWVPLLVPLWLVLALGLAPENGGIARSPVRWVPASMALLLLALSNVTTGITPRARPEANPHLQMALAVGAHTRATDVIVLAGTGDYADAEVYVPYFAKRRVLSVHSLASRAGGGAAALHALNAEVREALVRGRRVFIHEELISSDGPYAALAARYGLERRQLVRFLRRRFYIGRPVRWRAGGAQRPPGHRP